MRITKGLFFFLLLLTVGFVACSDDPEEQDPKTVVDIAIENDFTSLAAALERANLVDALNGTGPFTVFAPTDDAFADFLSANGFATLEDVPVDVLTNVLLNHVLNTEALSTDLATGYYSTQASGPGDNNLSMYINLDNGVAINGVSNVTTADISADNGVVHVVDAVIGLPTVVTFATADPTFETLVSALTREEDFTFVETLSGEGPFTVFAPTNMAFTNLIAFLDGVNGLGDIPTETLSAVLQYHVVGGANVRSSTLTDQQVVSPILDGENFTVVIDGSDVTIVDANGRGANVVAVDVQAVNGVVHVIDQVILPTL